MEREPMEDYRPVLCVGCVHFVQSLMKNPTDPVGSCWRLGRHEERQPDEVLQDFKVECNHFCGLKPKQRMTNIDILKQLAEEFKEPIELAIEKTKEYDLTFISSVERSGRRFTEREINGLKSNLKAIQRHQDEIRLIDEFVDYCDSQSLSTTAKRDEK